MRRGVRVGLGLVLTALTGGGPGRAATNAATNAFTNPSFELGRAPWHVSKAGQTEYGFRVEKTETPAGDHCARVTVGKVEAWGVQFGQSFDAGGKGKTYTFAAFGQAIERPVTVRLEVERRAKPWDRAGAGSRVTLPPGKWTECHVTFKVKTGFPQGWFAYVSCVQPGAQFRLDMLRLSEGGYVPYAKLQREDAALGGVRLFDTGTVAAAPLTAEAIQKKPGWTEVPEGRAEHGFKGDAVLLNNRLAVAVRRKAGGAEVHALGPKRAALRTVLEPLGAPPGARLGSIRILANTPNEGALEAAFQDATGRAAGLRLALKMGQPVLETRGLGATAGVRVGAPSRFVVLPDFFADDIVVDATTLPVDRVHLPSENFLLHLVRNGEAIVMAVWDRRGEDATVRLSGKGARRVITGSELRYNRGKVWLAVIDAPGVWYAYDVTEKHARRVVRLDWRQPFHAQWRVDWRRTDGLTDSWEMIVARRGGGFTKHGWFGSPRSLPANRRRWTTVLGNFHYPCWIDRTGRGWLQPIKHRELECRGPAVVYPINRTAKTPLEVFTVVDIVRQSLGVGPCEYILDLEGQQQRYRGRATCSCRDNLRAIYQRGQQKARRAEVEKNLAETLVFLRYIRGRIGQYVRFGHELLAYLAAQKRAHPELAKPLGELEALARQIDTKVARRQAKIRAPEYGPELIERCRKTLVGYEGKDAFKKCKALTAELVTLGGNQDELVGECRWVVKALRQRAGIAMAADPKLAAIAAEVRKRTRLALRNPASHEGSRH